MKGAVHVKPKQSKSQRGTRRLLNFSSSRQLDCTEPLSVIIEKGGFLLGPAAGLTCVGGRTVCESH